MTKDQNKNRKKKAIVFFIILILFVLAIGISVGMGDKQVVRPMQQEVEEGKVWNGELPKSGEDTVANTDTIEIPGYPELVVTQDSPIVNLINNNENTVYLKYTILKDGEVIFKTGLIKPGQMMEFNAYDALGQPGEYQLDFNISSFDIKDQAPCNGAKQLVKISVK